VNCQVCFPSDMECCAVRGQTAGLKHANGLLAGHSEHLAYVSSL